MLDPWSVYRLATPEQKTAEAKPKESESPSDVIRRRQEELQKKVDEILGKGAAPAVPEAPPGMPRQKRQACKSGHKIRIASTSCCGSVESGAQTEVSLPHTMRDVLWTASCLDPVADLDSHDSESVVIEAAPASFSVADIGSLELTQDDDLDDPDRSDDAAYVNDC